MIVGGCDHQGGGKKGGQVASDFDDSQPPELR